MSDWKLENDGLEKALRASLQREAAPADFAAKVLARAGESGKAAGLATIEKKPKAWLQRPFTLALAATLAAMAIVPAVVLDYQRREEVRGLKAKQDLLTALAITRDQLQHAREKVRNSTKAIQ